MRIPSGLALFGVLLVLALARGVHALLGPGAHLPEEPGGVAHQARDGSTPALHAAAWMSWPDGGACLCELEAPAPSGLLR
jgi:hypothetical protein